jgi:hypothetical protein
MQMSQVETYREMRARLGALSVDELIDKLADARELLAEQEGE